MCGLVAIINKWGNGFSVNQVNIFGSLLYLSGGFRGRDGTGVTVVDTLGNVTGYKSADCTDSFLVSQEFVALKNKAVKDGSIIFGHNRAATRGAINDQNAHPFVVDDKIVLAHNGTFFGETHKELKNTEVDSEAIAHVLAENDDVTEALKKVDAAYALMWYNVENKTFNTIRNSQRPLWFMELQGIFMYASEESFLQFVCNKFKEKPLQGPFEIKPYSHGMFTINYQGKVDATVEERNCRFEYPKQEHTMMIPYNGATKPEWPPFRPSGQHLPYIATQNAFVVDQVIKCLDKKVEPVLHGEFVEALKKYPEKSHIKALMTDIAEADAYPRTKNFVMVGTTLDANKYPVVFSMTESEMDDMLKMNNGMIFEMDVINITWNRREHLFPVNTNQTMDVWPGVMVVHTKNAKPIIVTEYQHEAC